MTISSGKDIESNNQKSLTFNKRPVFLILIFTFTVSFDSTVAIPIISNYAIALGASKAMAGFIVGVYSIVHIPSNIFLGRLVDKLGRKGLISLGIFLDGLSMLLYSLAQDPLFLLFARVIHGLGGGFGGPATMAYFSDATSQRRSGRGMALYGISIGFSNLIGFMLGGMLAQKIGYSNLFFLIAIVLFIMCLFSFSLPSIYKPPEESITFKEEFKIVKQTIFRKSMISPYISTLTLMFNLGIITATYTIMLKTAFYTDGQIGIILSIMVIFSILVHYPAGILSDKLGYIKVMLIGLILTALAFGILMTSLKSPIPMIGMIFFGLGHGMIFPSSASVIKDKTSDSESGIATGMFYALIVAGVAIGAPISGLVYHIYTDQTTLLLGIVAPLIVSVILIFLLRSSQKN